MPNKRNLKDYGFLVLKGMGMGAANTITGHTIAQNNI